MAMKQVELRLEWPEDVEKETPLLELAVVFKGNWHECQAYAADAGFEWRPASHMMFGGYWYNPVMEHAILPT